MNKEIGDSQTVKVYGDKFASRTVPAYLRQVSTRPVTFTCQACNQTVTQQRYPGPTPKYCSEVCAQHAVEARNEERVRKQREKRQMLAAQRKGQKPEQLEM